MFLSSLPLNLTILYVNVGHMENLITFLILVSFITGCTVVVHEDLISDSVDPRLMRGTDQFFIVDINLNNEKIIEGSSYIVDPNGKKYSILVKPHQYDIDSKFPQIRANVYPLQDDGGFLSSWINGIWYFHFHIESNGTRRIVEKKKKYWNFYYNFIVHGPPN